MAARSTMRYSSFNQHKLNELIRLEVLVVGNTFELYIQNSLHVSLVTADLHERTIPPTLLLNHECLAQCKNVSKRC